MARTKQTGHSSALRRESLVSVQVKLPPTPPLTELCKSALAQDGKGDSFPFFRLPPELRNKIYQQCYSSHKLVLGYWPRAKRAFTRWTIYEDNETLEETLTQRGRLLRLLLACKTAYIEAISVLYAGVRFRVNLLSYINSLVRLVGPNGRHLIKDIEQWHHVFKRPVLCRLDPLVHELVGLKKLTIQMTVDHYSFEKQGDDMHPVCVLRDVELQIKGHGDSFEDDLHEAEEQKFQAYRDAMIAHVAQSRLEGQISSAKR